MSAKEMFEELKFKMITNDNEFLTFTKEVVFSLGHLSELKIVFDLTMKEINYHYGTTENTTILFKSNASITPRLLKAINKQIEELGWKE